MTDATTTPPKVNGLAIAGMILGIVWVYWIGSILAVIFGHVSLRTIKRSGGAQTGQGFAIAAIALGWTGVGFLCLFLLAIALGSTQGG